MPSILNISDVAIEAYHLSLRDFFQDRKRAGKYYIHFMRVTLVRLPQKIDRFATRNERPLFVAGLNAVGLATVITIGIMHLSTFYGSTIDSILIFNEDRIDKAFKRGIWKQNTGQAV